MPSFTAWLRTNHKPIIIGGDDGWLPAQVTGVDDDLEGVGGILGVWELADRPRHPLRGLHRPSSGRDGPH